MAELDKLAIRGVRSFGPRDVNIIQFFKPLTVIVGHNGSGKTTIVECLKYAATGDLPPHTKGGGFLHDPNMAGTDTVKAQVRLRFRNTHGVRMNCVRNLQVSKKKGGGLSMKTLEGVLGIDDEEAEPHARNSISTRCAELDTEMASLLGVPRAILEHVLFCHQEEANWPLAEPAILKKRFDEIFEVSRYTKALDTIRSLRKQRAQDARVDEAELRALQQDKERADSIRRTITTLQETLLEKRVLLEDLDDDIRRKTAENQTLYDDATRFREVVNRAEILEEKLALYAEHKRTLEARMSYLDIPDDELARLLTSHPQQLAAQQAQLEELQRNMQTYTDQRKAAAVEHERLIRRHAELEAARSTRERQRNECAQELEAMGASLKDATWDAIRAAATSLDTSWQAQQKEWDTSARNERRALQDREQQERETHERLETKLRDLHARREHTQASLERLRERIDACEEGGDDAASEAIRWRATFDVLHEAWKASEERGKALSARLDDLQCGFESVDAGLRNVQEELHAIRESLGLLEHASAVFERIQHHAHDKHVCLACEQAVPPSSLPAFDAHIAQLRQRSSAHASLAADLTSWVQMEAKLYMAKEAHIQRTEHFESHAALSSRMQDAKQRAESAAARARGAPQGRLDEYAADARELEAALEDLNRACDDMTEPLQAACSSLESARQERLKVEDRHEGKRREFQDVLDRLHRVMTRFDDTDDGSSLETCNLSLKRASAALDDAVRAAERAMHDSHTLETALRDARAYESNVRDNVQFREAEKAYADAQAQHAALDLEAAYAAHAKANQVYDEARRAEQALGGRAAHLRGEMAGIEAELERRHKELQDDYSGISERYMRQLVHIKVAGMANRDLDTYCAAFQQAILQYHGIKMEEVNQTLDYLWKKTYQGTDIDSVCIRADSDGTSGGLRAYQYRVCMRKDGIELDMRGRCSTGQKVLACILIRLALADSFGGACGCMALDEPTTNLDRENVEALAASLVDLLAERQHQPNFQLIVITHDEEFLTRLSQSDALEHYWRVSRDTHLHSTIERDIVQRS